ncbi:hypothetical protein [Acuticoccus sediminis]|uniref:hypothetical protein n=1 Tax=Acuticoccus sediminis TaxID=2184697 RepID=UPI001CFE0BE2|nr:hypothetical protein [Acuticoccus sediminis]
MTVPAMLIMSGLRLIQRQSDDRSRGRELAIQRAHEREVLRMEIEAAGQRHERQKAVLLAILEASERLAVLKLEHMMTIFREAKGVMLAHQTALVEEKSSLTSILLASDVNPARFVLIQKRQREIGRELSDIDEALAQLSETAMSFIDKARAEIDAAHQQALRLEFQAEPH